MTADEATVVSAVAASIQAGAAVAALVFAIAATAQWRATLGSQRHDECVLALHELLGAHGRMLSAAREGVAMPTWAAYNDTWATLRAFDAAYTVARRYNPSLPAFEASQIRGRMELLQARFRNGPPMSDAEIKDEKAKLTDVLFAAQKALA